MMCLSIMIVFAPAICEPNVLPADGYEQQQLMAWTQESLGMPFVCALGWNWLRHRGDPEAITIHVTWFYAALNCRRQEWDELAGDLNLDDRVNLLDFAEFARWWATEPIVYPPNEGPGP